jgi:hypothetical protein
LEPLYDPVNLFVFQIPSPERAFSLCPSSALRPLPRRTRPPSSSLLAHALLFHGLHHGVSAAARGRNQIKNKPPRCRRVRVTKMASREDFQMVGARLAIGVAATMLAAGWSMPSAIAGESSGSACAQNDRTRRHLRTRRHHLFICRYIVTPSGPMRSGGRAHPPRRRRGCRLAFGKVAKDARELGPIRKGRIRGLLET